MISHDVCVIYIHIYIYSSIDTLFDGVWTTRSIEVFHVADDLWDHLFFRSGGGANSAGLGSETAGLQAFNSPWATGK